MTVNAVTGLETPSACLRVLMVTPRYLPLVGGTEIHTYETARRIAAGGHSITVLTTHPGGSMAEEEFVDGVRIMRVRAWPNGTDYYLAPQIYDVIADRRWDLVHCQGGHTLVPPLAMLAALWANIPYVLTFHSGGHSSRLRNSVRASQWALLRPLLARAERLIGVSKFEAEFFRDRLRLSPDKFVIIPNGAELPASTLNVQTRSDEALIVSVGRLERYKGHHRVIAALPHLLEHRPDARLSIVGAGPFEPALTELARSLGVADRVEIGAIPSSDRTAMMSLLARASVVTLLSDYESHGIAVMEALSLKRPVLVADTSALRELAERGFARAVPLDSSPQTVAAAILEQLERPLIPPDVEIPSWDDCAGDLLGLYRRVVRTCVCVSS